MIQAFNKKNWHCVSKCLVLSRQKVCFFHVLSWPYHLSTRQILVNNPETSILKLKCLLKRSPYSMLPTLSRPVVCVQMSRPLTVLGHNFSTKEVQSW